MKILFDNAVIRSILGRDQQALDWLERAVKLGCSRAQIDAAPEFERFRDHSRFQEIYARAD